MKQKEREEIEERLVDIVGEWDHSSSLRFLCLWQPKYPVSLFVAHGNYWLTATKWMPPKLELVSSSSSNVIASITKGQKFTVFFSAFATELEKSFITVAISSHLSSCFFFALIYRLLLELCTWAAAVLNSLCFYIHTETFSIYLFILFHFVIWHLKRTLKFLKLLNGQW